VSGYCIFPLACAELRDTPSPPMHVHLVLSTETCHSGLIKPSDSFTNRTCARACRLRRLLDSLRFGQIPNWLRRVSTPARRSLTSPTSTRQARRSCQTHSRIYRGVLAHAYSPIACTSPAPTEVQIIRWPDNNRILSDHPPTTIPCSSVIARQGQL
jgi:hypothetical protein